MTGDPSKTPNPHWKGAGRKPGVTLFRINRANSRCAIRGAHEMSNFFLICHAFIRFFC